MPKRDRHRSPSLPRKRRYRHHKRSRGSSRSNSRSSHNLVTRDRSPIRISNDSEVLSSAGGLAEVLNELLDFLRQREIPRFKKASVDHSKLTNLISFENAATFLDEPGEASVTHHSQTSEQVALRGRGGEPGSGPPLQSAEAECSPVSAISPALTVLEESGQGEDISGRDALALQLFGEQAQSTVEVSWSPIILDTAKSELRSGLKEDLKKNLLSKHEPKGDLMFLIPPKINKKIIPVLGATAITRDKHQVQSQAQLGASLNALGSGLSKLIGLECLQASLVGKAAISKIAESFRLLTDLHFRLFQARRAFIIPSLNFLGRSASVEAPIDDCLFGNNFAKEINTAQTIEKVARKMAKKAPQPSSQLPRQPADSTF